MRLHKGFSFLNKKDQNSDMDIDELISNFQPKIKASLRHTASQEREDLEQEITIKIIEKMETIQNLEAPGFWDFLEKIQNQKSGRKGE
ncbi:hypothetical protein [Bacillus tuaregi]|uniref:hypothetical protein n=1 Tax=Bacillus tuaregi TaxID=1816695 RepID=UPI0008F8DF08|nr:hypothetical protein [Bacillus tuaregi]